MFLSYRRCQYVRILATLALSVYLVWMFRHFRTTFTVHHPLEALMQQHVSDYFKHPYGNTNYGHKICPFGQHAILALVAFLWLRVYLEVTGSANKAMVRTLSQVVLGIVVLCSLMNMNAVLYLIPYFVYEGWWLDWRGEKKPSHLASHDYPHAPE